MPYKIVKNEQGEYCVYKRNPEGMPVGDSLGCHASEAEAQAQMRALYAREQMQGDYLLVENYVTVKPGEPYRLLPYGMLVKNGKRREINQELAGKFRLPHFKPPIKLGSHADDAPAGGHIVGLEIRADGLYAIPETTERGRRAMDEGSYRYHSPEIYWGDIEHPETGDKMPGPFIVGDAWLHTPHLGEAAALYTVTPIGDDEMDTIQLPASLFDRLMARFFPEREDEPMPEPMPDPDIQANVEKLTALERERDEYRTKLEMLEAEAAKRERLQTLTAELPEAVDKAGIEHLAGMEKDAAEWVISQFKALAEQIKESNLVGNPGNPGTDDNLTAKLDAEVQKLMTERKMAYHEAIGELARTKPELFVTE
jgi:hypothetical protein